MSRRSPAILALTIAWLLSPPALPTARAAVTLTHGPEAARDGDLVAITFTASEAADVEVAVVDAEGRTVRHLAAGMLGPNAPVPLAKDALAQRLVWDGRDDRGRPAKGGPFRVRVRAGAEARLERIAGWDGNTIGHREFVAGMTVGPERELYVLLAEQWHGRSEVRVFGPDGRYRRTILPYPTDTPPERTDPVGTLTIDGARQPIVFNAHGHTLAPLVAGLKKQTCFFSPKGHLVLASAVGSLQEHGPPRHLLALHPEGGAPPETGFVGPRLMEARGFMGGAGESGAPWFDHLATSPDGRWIYVTLYGESYKFTQRHAVFRLAWADEALGGPFLGADEAGGDPAVPDEAQPYRTGYLNVDAAVEGAEWRYAGCSPVPATGLNWGDPACTCWTSRLAVDPYGRVYVPNVFRGAVEVIDSAANPIARVGRYGNADSAGPGSRVPQPAIPIAWPAFLATADGRLYVSDPVNRRVTIVAFEYDAGATCPVP